MANYTKATDFAAKDGLTSGDPAKIVKGAEIDDEFNSIVTAVNSKANVNSPAFTGVPTAPTAASGTSNTQVATTAFVQNIAGSLGTISSQDADNVSITGGSITGLSSALPIGSGGTGLTSVGSAGSVLTSNGNAASWVAPASSLRLMTKTEVYDASPGNGSSFNVSLPTSLFGGNTPSFVMFSGSARVTGLTDIRYFYLTEGSTNQEDMVMASSSDDSDQNGTARGEAATTFILPYSSTKTFYAYMYGARIILNVIGYQV